MNRSNLGCGEEHQLSTFGIPASSFLLARWILDIVVFPSFLIKNGKEKYFSAHLLQKHIITMMFSSSHFLTPNYIRSNPVFYLTLHIVSLLGWWNNVVMCNLTNLFQSLSSIRKQRIVCNFHRPQLLFTNNIRATQSAEQYVENENTFRSLII